MIIHSPHVPLYHYLPQDILSHIYKYDATYSDMLSSILLDDIIEYRTLYAFYYTADGVHEYALYPRYWVVETNLSLVDVRDQEGDDDQLRWRILRIFQRKHDKSSFLQSLCVLHEKRVSWTYVSAYFCDSFHHF